MRDILHAAQQKRRVSQGLSAVLGDDGNVVPPKCWMLRAQAISLPFPSNAAPSFLKRLIVLTAAESLKK